jgi:hypothetical protein
MGLPDLVQSQRVAALTEGTSTRLRNFESTRLCSLKSTPRRDFHDQHGYLTILGGTHAVGPRLIVYSCYVTSVEVGCSKPALQRV